MGIPVAFSIFLFDFVTIITNRLTASYGDIPLAAMGIVLKLERIPINISSGILLGMVPLVAYSYGAGNKSRMLRLSSLARISVIGFSVFCVVFFWLFSGPIVGVFIKDAQTVRLGAQYLRIRCLALPFMLSGNHVVNFMNAVDRGKVSFLLAIIRHLVLIVPILFVMNYLWGMTGFLWAQVVADVLNVAASYCFFVKVKNEIMTA